MGETFNPATRRVILYLAASGFVLRLCARLYSGAQDFWSHGYTLFFTLAHNIATGNGIAMAAGFPTAFRVPLYPIFLAMITQGRKVFLPVVVAQSLIGAGTVWCAAVLAFEMFGEGAAILAAGVTAIYPYYLVHDTALQETSLFTLLTAVAVILLRRTAKSGSEWTALCARVVLGLDVLTRATIAPFAVLAPVWLIWISAGKPATCAGSGRVWPIALKSALPGLLCAAMLGLVVGPWLFRSWKLTGLPVLATETGLELWNGNNARTFSYYPYESSDLSKEAALDGLTPAEQNEIREAGDNEAAADRWFWHRGMSYIRLHPWLTIANGFRKIEAAFGWLPSPRRGLRANLIFALSYGPVMLLGLFGMWLSRGRIGEDSIIYLVFACFLAVTAVFFGHTSHRSYLDVYWIVYAAGVWAERRGTRAACA